MDAFEKWITTIPLVDDDRKFAEDAFRAGMRAAAEIVKDEKVDEYATHAAEDKAYNIAIEHCIDAILAEADK